VIERDSIAPVDPNVIHAIVPDHGRGVAEEVFDLALVAIRRVLVADRLARGASPRANASIVPAFVYW
jgi:hypothetical protein